MDHISSSKRRKMAIVSFNRWTSGFIWLKKTNSRCLLVLRWICNVFYNSCWPFQFVKFFLFTMISEQRYVFRPPFFILKIIFKEKQTQLPTNFGYETNHSKSQKPNEKKIIHPILSIWQNIYNTYTQTKSSNLHNHWTDF